MQSNEFKQVFFRAIIFQDQFKRYSELQFPYTSLFVNVILKQNCYHKTKYFSLAFAVPVDWCSCKSPRQSLHLCQKVSNKKNFGSNVFKWVFVQKLRSNEDES